MSRRPAERFRIRLGLGLLAVILVGGAVGIRLLTPRIRHGAAPGPAELRFVRSGVAVATLDLAALQRLAATRDVVGPDPYYQRRKHFRALPIEPLVVGGFGEALAVLQQRDFVLHARDGYAVPVAGAQLLLGGAHIAFADADAPAWEPIGPQHANPGPFYLVWDRPEQGNLTTHPRPWQLVSIESVEPAGLFPHAMPRGVGKDAPAQRGALLFRRLCSSCHAMNRDGGRVGPELNVPQSIVEYRPRPQILAYIRDPRVFRYSNMPPHLDLTDAQLAELMGYFEVMSTQKYDPEASAAPAGTHPGPDGGR